jgi:hypothetical protein
MEVYSMAFDWKAWGIEIEPDPAPRQPVALQSSSQTDTPPANCSPYQPEPELSAARVRMEQALFVLRECELIEEERKRQHIPRVWIDRGEWLELCAERLKWSADDCTDALLALTQAQRIEIHHSERGIREVWQ